jgi:hypothetical protein
MIANKDGYIFWRIGFRVTNIFPIPKGFLFPRSVNDAKTGLNDETIDIASRGVQNLLTGNLKSTVISRQS